MTRAPEAVLLHGFLGSAADFAPVVERLSVAAHALDLPGHGTPPQPVPRGGFEAACEQVAARIRTTTGGVACQLAGYSMGGRVAIAVALRHPELVRTLVVVSAHPGLEGAAARATRRGVDARRACALRADAAAFLDAWYRQPLFAPLAQTPQFAELRVRRARGDARAMARALVALSTGRQPDLRPALRTFRVPTLFIAGALDQRYAELGRVLAQQCPTVVFRAVAGTGHAVPQEDPAAFAALLEAYWSAPGTLS